MLIAVLLIMLMISAISISLLVRSVQGTQMGIISRDSHNAYQLSDQKVEEVLINLQKLDAYDKKDKTGLSNDGLIPENTKATELCYNGENEKTICYPREEDGDPDLLNPLEKKADLVKDIYFVQRNGATLRTQRAVLAPVMDRTINPVTDLLVTPDGLCAATLKFKCAFPSKDKLEIRESSDSTTVSDKDDFKGKWMKLTGDYESSALCDGVDDPDLEKTISLNTANFDSDISGSIYLIIKAKSERKFRLDSLYVKATDPIAATVGSCTGS